MRLGEIVRIEGGREADVRFGGVIAERGADGGFAFFRYWRRGAGKATLKEPAGSAADARGAVEWLVREGCDCATFVHGGAGGGVRTMWQRLGPWMGETGRMKDEGGRMRKAPARAKTEARGHAEAMQVLLFEDGARRIA